MNNLKLTSDQVSNALYGESICDDEKELFTAVSSIILDADQEHNSATFKITIKEISTGKFYQADLGSSPWVGQTESNYKTKWKEVFPKRITTTVYE